jgi:hypothetical protein
MVIQTEKMEEVEKLIKRKWSQMHYRVNNQKSYIKKGIRVDFDDFNDFRQYALSKDIKKGFHCHRPDRYKNYSRDNLEFISADAHRRITAKEKRKLSDNDVRCIRDMALFRVTQRKIAAQFHVSQATIWKILNGLAYADVL